MHFHPRSHGMMLVFAFVCLTSLISSVAFASSPSSSWVGAYATCGQSEGNAWKLTSLKGRIQVSYRPNSLEAWTTVGEAKPMDKQALAELNATGSSRASQDQAVGALEWDHAHFLRMPTGWFGRYRQPGQDFNPDLVLTGNGQAVFLCRLANH